MKHFLTFLFAFVTWLILSGNFDAFHISAGVFCSVLVTALTSHFFWGEEEGPLKLTVGKSIRAVGYFFWLVWEVVKANVHVFILAFSPRPKDKMEPQIFTFKCGLKSDFAKFVLGNSITLTPGTVTLAINGDEFVIHAISDHVAADLRDNSPSEMEQRVAKVFD